MGAQETVTDQTPVRVPEMLPLVTEGVVDLVVRGAAGQVWRFDQQAVAMMPGDGSPAITVDTLMGRASTDQPQTWTVLPAGLSTRLGFDRDGDGIGDAMARSLSTPSSPISRMRAGYVIKQRLCHFPIRPFILKRSNPG